MRSSTTSGRGKARPLRSSKGRAAFPDGFLDIESRLKAGGARLVAGVDEAGRGPLAGPVVAAAVVLDENSIPAGIRDSKCLSPARRFHLCHEIKRTATAVGLGIVSARGIDRVNILRATMHAMARAVDSLGISCDFVIVDGKQVPRLNAPAMALIKGDSRCISVAAASIVAKVTRDMLMERMDVLYPRYCFASNKGYGTPDHIAALKIYGPTRLHRLSFAPVTSAVEAGA